MNQLDQTLQVPWVRIRQNSMAQVEDVPGPVAGLSEHLLRS